MFIADAIPKNHNGRAEFPTDLNTKAKKLYKKTGKIPKKIIHT